MRVLTIDIGNTAVKGSIFENGVLLESILQESRDVDALLPLCRRHEPDGAICCCVGQDARSFVERLEEKLRLSVMLLGHDTPLPIKVEYGTPGTLGLDRIAAAAGAGSCMKGALIVDAGTAVTLDIVANDTFLGGNISPGLRLRFRSLNHYTSRLPLVSPSGDIPSFGYDTATAIRTGVVNGMLAEIKYTYQEALSKFPGLRFLLTGGDADFLAPMLRESGLEPEVSHSLVGQGLERIFLYASGKLNVLYKDIVKL